MTEITASPVSAATVRVTVGNSFMGFRDSVVREDARQSVEDSAVRVLEAALSSGPSSTGLVVGRVQSGKTLSYEGVISLARDNGFAIVIVISGISKPLLAQGETRLGTDLTRGDPDGWLFLLPSDGQAAPNHVKRELARVSANWREASTPQAYKQTAVVVVLKHHDRILDLAGMFGEIDLDGLPVLIVDDEADQASLNAKARRGQESTTYSNIAALRSALPTHYYLQYTATPQAPLLVAIQDSLSPDYVCVLEPGNGYTGGDVYFGASQSPLVQTISGTDIAAISTPGGPPPESLQLAMRQFLLGAAHVVACGGRPETRSMLVHPSRSTDPQGTFTRWVTDLRDNWMGKYRFAAEDPPLRMRGEFEAAWVDLQATFPAIKPFDDCWNCLGVVFRNLDVTEVNTRAGQTPVINWVASKSYILVGGQAIDRGFTVEGLTVTYMPRGAGTFTADTIQQRARFFGYKANYLGLCRVYLDPDVRSAFKNYVEHERDMLVSLREIESGADSLKSWKRRFLMDPSMRPTRASVVEIPLARVTIAERWIYDRTPARVDAPSQSDSILAIDEVLAGSIRHTDSFGNDWTLVRPAVALELLERVAPESLLSEANFQALSFALARMADENPVDECVSVHWMRFNGSDRTELSDGSIQIFQGRSPGTGAYPGDRKIFRESSLMSVQLHKVNIRKRAGGSAVGTFITTAWHVSDGAATGWLIEVPN